MWPWKVMMLQSSERNFCSIFFSYFWFTCSESETSFSSFFFAIAGFPLISCTSRVSNGFFSHKPHKAEILKYLPIGDVGDTKLRLRMEFQRLILFNFTLQQQLFTISWRKISKNHITRIIFTKFAQLFAHSNTYDIWWGDDVDDNVYCVDVDGELMKKWRRTRIGSNWKKSRKLLKFHFHSLLSLVFEKTVHRDNIFSFLCFSRHDLNEMKIRKIPRRISH